MEKNNKADEIKDGVYLFYVKDKQIYPTIMSDDQWKMLQLMSNAIMDGPINVLDKPMGSVEKLSKEA